MSDTKLALPPPTFPSCKALSYALMGWMGSDWAAAKFITTYGADVMAEVALVQRVVTLANGMSATYWMREGVKAAGAASPPAILVLPGLREKVFPAARLAQTLGMPTATVYVVDLPTCGGHCLPVVGEQSDPVPSGAFSRHPVRVAAACELLKGLIDHLGLSSRTAAGSGFVLLGFSTGAHVAYSFAASHAAALPLRGLGLIHPAGHCLADSLLDVIAADKMDAFPFAFESAAQCRNLYFEQCGGIMDPGDWVFRGDEYVAKTSFPPNYWRRLCETWAEDYKPIADARARGQPQAAAELATELAAVRASGLPTIVLGSSGDVVCSAAKMESDLAPALGAEYLTLPNGGGHIFYNDAGNNGSVYDLAGPVLAAWMAQKVAGNGGGEKA